MAKSISGEGGYTINLGMKIDTESGNREINKFISNAKKTKSVPLQIEIDGKKFKKTIEEWKNKLTGEKIELTYLEEFKKGWHSAKQTVDASVTGIVSQTELVNQAIKHQDDVRQKSHKELQKYWQEKRRIAEEEEKIAKKQQAQTEKSAQKAETKELKDRIRELEKLNKTLEREMSAEKKASEQAEKHAEQQRRLAEEAKRSNSIFSSFTDTFLKMVKFNTINIIYDGIIDTMREAIEVTKEFNDATTELRKVSDLEGESLKEYAKQLAEYGATVGRTMTDMVNSATVFKRTGASDEDAIKLATIAEMYRNVADSEITSAEASSFLVSQMKAFNYTADESIHIIDSVNAVANNYAVSTDDLQLALSKSAAAMATAGNTYEETIALVESATAIMQGNAGTVGNGLRTIAINIANLATKQDVFTSASGKVNVALKDEQGNLRSTYAILNDLSKNWDSLTVAEQNSIAVSLAGKQNIIPSLARYKPI